MKKVKEKQEDMNSKFLKWAGCLAAMFALAACSSEENIAVDENTPVGIEFSAGIDGTLTRAVDTSWGEGDAIGISCSSTGNTNYANKKYVTNDGSGAFSYSGGNTGIFFQDKADVEFSAYYPFEGTDGTAIDNDVVTSRTTNAQTNSKKFDFLFASGVVTSLSNATLNPTTGKYSVPVSFTGEKNNFKHKMSRLVLKIKTDTEAGFLAKDVINGTYYLSNIEHEGTFNTNTGDAAASNPKSATASGYWQINATPVDGADNVRTYSMILFPQELNSTFKATINGGDYTCPLTLPAIESGKSYEYTITVKKTGLVVSECTISAWGTDGASGNGSTTVGETPVTVDLQDASTIYVDNTYTVPQNASVIIDGGGVALEKRLRIEDGARVVLKNVILHSPEACKDDIIGVYGDATLILSGTNEIKGSQRGAIVVEKGTLTISGTNNDKLDVTALDFKGAGCLGAVSGANIIINGGNINATATTSSVSDYGSAGIGTFWDGVSGDDTSINITINGGIINAKGGINAAGIGSCYKDAAMKGNIVIKGGNVTAIGGVEGAGIGSGREGNYGSITISGVNTVVYAECGADNGFAIYDIGPGTYDPERGGTTTREAVNIGDGAVITTKHGSILGH